MKNKKRTVALSMMTQAEIKAHISPYDSKAWNIRKEAIRRKVLKHDKPKEII